MCDFSFFVVRIQSQITQIDDHIYNDDHDDNDDDNNDGDWMVLIRITQ